MRALLLNFVLILLFSLTCANLLSWGKKESIPLGVSISEIKGYYGNGRSPTKVVVGGNKVFTLNSEGRLIAWGEGHFGNANAIAPDGTQSAAIGRNYKISSPSLLFWTNLYDAYFYDIAVAPDGSFFCGVLMTGYRQVLCFGNNDWFQMGPAGDAGGAFADSPVVFQDPRASDIRKIYAGNNFACVLYNDGAIGCWGGNDHGQLAEPLTTTRSQSAIVTTSVIPFTSISVGSHHVAACKADGTFWAWGRNDYNQVSSASTAPVIVPTSDMQLTNGNCSRTEANYHASYMVTDRGMIRIKGAVLRPELVNSATGETEVSGGNITGAIVYDISARGGDLVYVARTNGVPSVLNSASAGSFVNTLSIPIDEPQVWALPSSTESSNLIDLNRFSVNPGNPYQAKQLMEYIKRVSEGDYVTQIATGNNSYVAITMRGRVFSWARTTDDAASRRLRHGVALLPETSSPVRVDTMGLLGSFDVLNVRAAKTRFGETQRWTLLHVYHPTLGATVLFQGYSTSHPGSVAFPYIENPRYLVSTPIAYSRNDIMDASANYIVLYSSTANAVFSTVWGGSSWTQISGIPSGGGTTIVSHIAISSDTGYAVVAPNQIWSWPLAKSGDLLTVQAASATRIDGGSVSGSIISFSVGPYGNIFAVDSQQRLYSFGNNVASDGSLGSLCQAGGSSGSSSIASPTFISGISDVSEIQANGDTVYAISANRTTLWACGRALYLGLGEAPSNASALFSNFSTVAMPPLGGSSSLSIRILSVGAAHSHAVLSDGSIYSWGLNDANQSNVGSAIVVATPERLKDPTNALSQRSIDAVSSGLDYSIVSSRLSVSPQTAVIDPTASALLIRGSSFSGDAIIYLTYPDLPAYYSDTLVICSVITVSPDGGEVFCLPYLPDYPEEDLNYLLNGALIEEGISTTRVFAQIVQGAGLESMHTPVQVATVVLPELTPCAQPCNSFTITTASEITLRGARLGTSTADISIALLPSGFCVPTAVTDGQVTCKIQGVLLEGELKAAAFRGSTLPQSLSDVWIDRFVPVRTVKSSPALDTSSRQIPRTAQVLTISGTNLSSNLEVFLPSLDVSCPPIFINSSYIACNLSSINFGNVRGPLEAVVRQDGGSSSSVFVSVVVTEPIPAVRRNDTKIAENADLIYIEAGNIGSSTSELSVTIQSSPNSNKRNIQASVACSVTSIDANGLYCSPSADFGSGMSLNAIIYRATGPSPPFFLGVTVPAPVILSYPNTLASNVADVTLYGSNFLPEGADISLVSSSSSTVVPCAVSLASSSSTLIKCIPSTFLPLGSFSINYVSYGGRATPFPAQPVSVVPPPSLVSSFDPLFDTAIEFILQASNTETEPAKNLVFLTLDSTASESALIKCETTSRSETSLTCRTNRSFVGSNLGALYAILSAHGGRSNLTQIGVLVKDTSFLATVGPGGVSGIAIAAAGMLIVLIILIIILIRKKRIADARRRNAKAMSSVPDDQKHLFNIRASDLTIIKKLGEGSFGAVYLGKFKRRFVAIKKLAGNVLASQVNDFFRESALMLSIPPSPYVVRQFGMCQELGNMSMVMEFLSSGSLDSYLQKHSGNQLLDEDLLYRLAMGIARGMAHLAENRIVHRDLAARNILLDSNMNPKVSDFGFSRVVGSEAVGKTATTVGPVRWMAPEAIGKLVYSEKSDVWSYAVVLYEIAERKEPYLDEDAIKVAVDIRDHARNPMSDMVSNPPDWFLEVMRMSFESNPEERPTFARIVSYLESHKPANYIDVALSVVELPTSNRSLQRGETTRYLPIQAEPDPREDTSTAVEMNEMK